MSRKHCARGIAAVLLSLLLGGCGSASGALGTSAGSAPSDGPQTASQLLDSVVSAIGPGHFTSVQFGHDPDGGKPGTSWLDVALSHPTVAAGTVDYWAAVLLERQYNDQAAGAGVAPLAGMTITAPTSDGGIATDGQVENPRALSGAPLSVDDIKSRIETWVNGRSDVSLRSVEFVGTKSNAPVVTLQTEDAAAFVKDVQNPYYAIFGEDNIQGGYVQVSDPSRGVFLVGAAVPSEGFTAVWVPPDLDWHTYEPPPS